MPYSREIEEMLDARVQSLLARDAAYRNAETADEQAERERELTEAVEREFAAGVQRRLTTRG